MPPGAPCLPQRGWGEPGTSGAPGAIPTGSSELQVVVFTLWFIKARIHLSVCCSGLSPSRLSPFFFFFFSCFFSSVFAARRNKQRGRRRAAAGKRYLLKHNAAVPFGREAALTSRQRGFSRTPSPRRVVPTSRRLLRNADSPRGSVLKAGRPRGSASIWPPEPGGGGEKWCRAPGARGAGGRVL